jgi:uncharacterized membrane protein
MASQETGVATRVGKAVTRVLIGVFMVVAGISHFTQHGEFLQQTPTWLPARSLIVWATGVMEIGVGVALLVLSKQRRHVGQALAIFLVAVFPGNIYQALAGTDAFGLDTDAARWGRLLLQPVLIALVLWCTDGWPRWRRREQRPAAGLR